MGGGSGVLVETLGHVQCPPGERSGLLDGTPRDSVLTGPHMSFIFRSESHRGLRTAWLQESTTSLTHDAGDAPTPTPTPISTPAPAPVPAPAPAFEPLPFAPCSWAVTGEIISAAKTRGAEKETPRDGEWATFPARKGTSSSVILSVTLSRFSLCSALPLHLPSLKKIDC